VSRPLPIKFDFDFRANYEVEQLDRIDRSGGRRAYGYPGVLPVPLQQELADGPIVAVTPQAGEPWLGVFSGGGFRSTAAETRRLIVWPDGQSLCVVYAGCAVVVRADEPTRAYEIEAFPVTQAFVAPEQRVVVFADFTNLVAYGADGLLWRSRRLALDEVRVEAVEADALRVSGFFGLRSASFLVDLATGEASGQPFQPPE
jgi:hypothetical protein